MYFFVSDKLLSLSTIFVTFGNILLVSSSDFCDNSVFRCPYGRNCFTYNKKSECVQQKGSDDLHCKQAPSHRICLNTRSVCDAAKKYIDFPRTSSEDEIERQISTNTSGQMHCSRTHLHDGDRCFDHNQCKPVSGGIALCCHHQCIHVHNIPCVRGFFKEEDRLCNDKEHFHIKNHRSSYNGTSNSSTANPCSKGEPAKDAKGDQYFCGRSSSHQDCPPETTCKIDPADQYAVCCPTVAEDSSCQDGSQPVKCLIAPCSTKECELYPTASCVDDYCGGCNARFYVAGQDITNDCEK